VRPESLVESIFPGSEVVRAWELAGGVSARATAVELRRADGEAERLVIRRHRRAAMEFRLLRLLQAAGVAAPSPRHADEECIVTSYVEGESGTGQNDPAQLAAALAELHRVDRSAVDLSFLPRLADGPAQHEILFHGDFWPGNTLWRAGRLVALIDWEDAAVGDPLADLANGRLEVLFAFGEDAMDGFTDAYRAEMSELDYGDLPRWDLFAVRRLLPEIPNWGLDHAKEEELRRRSEWFAARAATWS